MDLECEGPDTALFFPSKVLVVIVVGVVVFAVCVAVVVGGGSGGSGGGWMKVRVGEVAWWRLYLALALYRPL